MVVCRRRHRGIARRGAREAWPGTGRERRGLKDRSPVGV